MEINNQSQTEPYLLWCGVSELTERINLELAGAATLCVLEV